jgi:hypothetical protein
MIEVERLCDVAARRLEPDNAKVGREKTDHQIRPLRWTMIAFNFLFGLIGAISVIALISSIILIIKGEQKEIENPVYPLDPRLTAVVASCVCH